MLGVLSTPQNYLVMGPSTVTERASDDKHIRSLDDTIFVAELFRAFSRGKGINGLTTQTFHILSIEYTEIKLVWTT